MRYLLLTLIVAFSLFTSSCSPSGSAPIGKKKMVSILVDIHIAQATLRRTDGVPLNQMQKNMYYKGILDRHGVTEAQLDSALSWYSRNTDDFKEVYMAVTDTIKKRRSRLDSAL